MLMRQNYTFTTSFFTFLIPNLKQTLLRMVKKSSKKFRNSKLPNCPNPNSVSYKAHYRTLLEGLWLGPGPVA